MILVTGGSGFIGSHLVRELIRRGERVRVYDLKPFPYNEVQIEMAKGSILDFNSLLNAMDGCNMVYHLAAKPGLWDRDPDIFDRVNRMGTENVLRAAEKTGVEKFIYTSTESILARRGNKGLINEDSEPLPEDITGDYCRSKFLAEQAVFRAAENGLNAIVVSPTMPIGPGDINLTPPGNMIANFLKGKIPGYIECTLNFVDVRDAALGHLLAAEKGRPRKRYILAGHNLNLAGFFSLLARISGRSAPAFKIPWSVAFAWSHIEEWIGGLTGRQPQSSVTGVRLCKMNLAFDGSRTWKEFGHSPRPIEESIRDAVSWHQGRL